MFTSSPHWQRQYLKYLAEMRSHLLLPLSATSHSFCVWTRQMIQTLNIKCDKRTAELKRGNDLFVMKLLLNSFSSTAHVVFFHAHLFIVRHVHTPELPGAVGLCVVAVVRDDGHFKASLQQLFSDWVPCPRTAQSQMTEVWFISRLWWVQGLP